MHLEFLQRQLIKYFISKDYNAYARTIPNRQTIDCTKLYGY